MKSDADEKELLKSVERGEWRSAGGGKRERYRVSDTAHSRYNALIRRLVNFRRAAECAQALFRIERGPRRVIGSTCR